MGIPFRQKQLAAYGLACLLIRGEPGLRSKRGRCERLLYSTVPMVIRAFAKIYVTLRLVIGIPRMTNIYTKPTILNG
jgi:hypothetical protein